MFVADSPERSRGRSRLIIASEGKTRRDQAERNPAESLSEPGAEFLSVEKFFPGISSGWSQIYPELISINLN